MRVKTIAARKHRKIKKLAKGFKQARRRRVKSAKEAILHAGQYSYIGRKLRKRDLRSLWIIRIGAASKKADISYSKFINLLKKNKIEIDRKILAEIAVSDPDTFRKIISTVS
jgi:large subunit ribosomal protein L20